MHYKIELGPNALRMRFQALDAKELRDVEQAAEYFVKSGDWRPQHIVALVV